MAIDFIELEHLIDVRVGTKSSDPEQPHQWPDLDLFGQTYVRPATTMGLPNNPGHFIVLPNGYSGEKTVELRKYLAGRPALQGSDVATPITAEEAASLPPAELTTEFKQVSFPIESNVPTEGSVDEESFPSTPAEKLGNGGKRRL
jgi:hypothetical protein